jgi:hypothetical protein
MGRNEEVKIRIQSKVSIMNVVERTNRPIRSFFEKYRFGFAGAKRDCGTSSFANSCCECWDIWLLLAV